MTLLVKCFLGKFEDMDPISRTYIKSWVWWHMLVIPALGRWRRSSLWGTLASQPHSICKVLDRSSENKVGGTRDGWHCPLIALRITWKMTYEPAYERWP